MSTLVVGILFNLPFIVIVAIKAATPLFVCVLLIAQAVRQYP
jgi:hypothetical protein